MSKVKKIQRGGKTVLHSPTKHLCPVAAAAPAACAARWVCSDNVSCTTHDVWWGFAGLTAHAVVGMPLPPSHRSSQGSWVPVEPLLRAFQQARQCQKGGQLSSARWCYLAAREH